MDIFRSIEEVPFQSETFLTLGTFDGIHCGHQRILDRLVRRAQEVSGRSFLVTFDPHPQMHLANGMDPVRLLTTLDEKIDCILRTGLDAVLVLRFTRELSVMEPDQFVRLEIAEKIGVREFFIGENHAFGRDRRGNAQLLKNLEFSLGYKTRIVPTVCIDGIAVSSTRIRKFLVENDVRKAARMLGRNYTLFGVVKKGIHRGQKLGFPTANIGELDSQKLVPGDGVYAVFVRMDGQKWEGTANIGTNPTFQDHARTIEVHIHEFSGDLYGKKLDIEWVDFLREEKVFHSAEALVEQMKSDCRHSAAVLAQRSP